MRLALLYCAVGLAVGFHHGGQQPWNKKKKKSFVFSPAPPPLSRSATTTTSPQAVTTKADEDWLNFVGKSLHLEVYDVDDAGGTRLVSRANDYALEVVKARLPTKDALGLELVEMASAKDGRGLVLVSGVSGAAAEADVRPGDALTFVRSGSVEKRLTELDYDNTMAALKETINEGDDTILMEFNRLVKRAPVTIEYEVYDDKGALAEGRLDALAGENLRRLLMRNHVQLYDPKTKRIDQPFATGDCAGEGICGTCIVDVLENADSLNPKDETELLITQSRPDSWRAACRCIVGADNKPHSATKIRLHPQSHFTEK